MQQYPSLEIKEDPDFSAIVIKGGENFNPYNIDPITKIEFLPKIKQNLSDQYTHLLYDFEIYRNQKVIKIITRRYRQFIWIQAVLKDKYKKKILPFYLSTTYFAPKIKTVKPEEFFIYYERGHQLQHFLTTIVQDDELRNDLYVKKLLELDFQALEKERESEEGGKIYQAFSGIYSASSYTIEKVSYIKNYWSNKPNTIVLDKQIKFIQENIDKLQKNQNFSKELMINYLQSFFYLNDMLTEKTNLLQADYKQELQIINENKKKEMKELVTIFQERLDLVKNTKEKQINLIFTQIYCTVWNVYLDLKTLELFADTLKQAASEGEYIASYEEVLQKKIERAKVDIGEINEELPGLLSKIMRTLSTFP